MGLRAAPWYVAQSESGVFSNVLNPNNVRSYFNLPQHLLYPTFRFWVGNTQDTGIFAGSLRIKLRFGFQGDQPTSPPGDVPLATEGIDFNPLAAPEQSDVRSPCWLPLVIAPNFFGSQTVGSGSGGAFSLGMLPPRVGIFLNVNQQTGFTGTYQVSWCGVIVE